MSTGTPSVGDLLTKEEIADWLRTTPRHIDRLVEQGELPYIRVGKFSRFRASDVYAYLDSHLARKEVAS